MADERWRRIESLFDEASGLAPAERDRFLIEACGADHEMRREIESLLAADKQADQFLARPVLSGPSVFPSPASLEGQLIGHYRVGPELGRGGMSTVYVATRADDAYQQRVALKVLDYGSNRSDLAARFRAERQIMASLDHRGIARLLDGGTTDDGRPYLVLEYIEGVPIDRYCDEHRLNMNARIDLFRQVCAAVQYAHQNLVVHRDIKPSNILVSREGVPRLLDFGIAKLLDGARLPGTIQATITGQRLMTPQYASPEQVEGGAITTATDVYSLGVLLYVLLAGRLPYRLEATRSGSLERAVVEQNPERPSSALGRLPTGPARKPSDGVASDGPTLDELCEARGLRPHQLRRKLRGDLDNIVLMALRKEPGRRYSSVNLLSEDLRRYRDNEPVMARADTLRYRARKFVARHKLGVGFATIVLAVISGLAGAMTVQAVRLARQRDEIKSERDKALAVSGFLEEVFAVSDPDQARGESVTAREILDKGAQRLTGMLAGQPETQAALALAMGKAYMNLGLDDRAQPLLEQSLAQRERLFGATHLDVAESLLALSVLHQNRGEFEAAETTQRRVLAIQRQLLPEGDRRIGDTLTDLSVTLLSLAKYAEAEAVVREALTIHRAESAENEAVAYDLNNLASILRRSGRFAEAESMYQDALLVGRKVFGSAHPQLTRTMNNLAVVLMDEGNLSAAEPLMREALTMTRKLHGDEHPDVALQLSNLSSMLGALGDDDAWIEMARQALDMRRRLFGPDHEKVGMSLANLGRAFTQKRQYAEARPLLEDALRIQRASYGDEHPRVADVLVDLADLFLAQDDPQRAELAAREALKIRKQALGETHADVGWATMTLGSSRLGAGASEEAEQLLRQGHDILARALPEGHWRTAEAGSRLGECLAGSGKTAEAEPLLVAGYDGLLRGRGPSNPRTVAALTRLVDFYDRQHNTAAAAVYRAKLPR